jgi:hypothetical protein
VLWNRFSEEDGFNRLTRTYKRITSLIWIGKVDMDILLSPNLPILHLNHIIGPEGKNFRIIYKKGGIIIANQLIGKTWDRNNIIITKQGYSAAQG